MSERTIQEIEDNYPEYLADTLGYRFDAWDQTPASEILAHDKLMQATSLDGVDPSGLSDLERWAYARRMAANNALDAFAQTVNMILASKEPHPALAVDEIYLRAIDVLAADQQFDVADTLFERFEKAFPDHPIAELAKAILIARQDAGKGQKSLEQLVETKGDDDELWIDIVAELLRVGRRDIALTWVAKARERLIESDNRTALIDLQLVEKELKRK